MTTQDFFVILKNVIQIGITVYSIAIAVRNSKTLPAKYQKILDIITPGIIEQLINIAAKCENLSGSDKENFVASEIRGIMRANYHIEVEQEVSVWLTKYIFIKMRGKEPK